MIVPVWISSQENLDSEILAYALFYWTLRVVVDQELGGRLQASMEPVKLKLSTMMGRDSIVKPDQMHQMTNESKSKLQPLRSKLN